VRVEKGVRLVHKRPAGRGCGSRSHEGKQLRRWRQAPMKGVKRSLVDYLEGLLSIKIRWSLGWWQAFLTAPPYPTGKRSEGDAVGKVCRGCDIGIFGDAFPSKDWAEQFCFSFQTPIRASEFMKRSWDAKRDSVSRFSPPTNNHRWGWHRLGLRERNLLHR